MTLTLDVLRTEVATLLEMPPAAIAPDANLYDLGLDSMRVMSIVLVLEERGIVVDYGALMEGQSLSDWGATLGLGN